jgi:hypothetical protein
MRSYINRNISEIFNEYANEYANEYMQMKPVKQTRAGVF